MKRLVASDMIDINRPSFSFPNLWKFHITTVKMEFHLYSSLYHFVLYYGIIFTIERYFHILKHALRWIAISCIPCLPGVRIFAHIFVEARLLYFHGRYYPGINLIGAVYYFAGTRALVLEGSYLVAAKPWWRLLQETAGEPLLVRRGDGRHDPTVEARLARLESDCQAMLADLSATRAATAYIRGRGGSLPATWRMGDTLMAGNAGLAGIPLAAVKLFRHP